MENTNNTSLERLSNPDCPATIEDFKEFGRQAENIVGKVSSTIDNISTSMVRIKEISAQVELECARMEHALDVLMLKAQRDVKIYEQSLPILDKQFESCQNRMDRLMDKAMDIITSDVSAESLNRQEAMMSLIELTNNSLNSLIAKLIPTY